MSGFKTKVILRKLMKKRLPANIVSGKKRGFTSPVSHWLAGPLYEWAEMVLAPDRIKNTVLLDAHFPIKLLREHKQRIHNHCRCLWTILCFVLWWEQFQE